MSLRFLNLVDDSYVVFDDVEVCFIDTLRQEYCFYTDVGQIVLSSREYVLVGFCR